MVPLIILLVILAIFGGLGFAAHVLWFVLIAAVILWLIGFLIGGAGAGMGRRRWYGRWWSPVTPRKRTLANRVRMPDAIRHRWRYAW